MKHLLLATILAANLTSCASLNPLSEQYAGPEFYYNNDGELWSCRPSPPNCRKESDWPDGGIGPDPWKGLR